MWSPEMLLFCPELIVSMLCWESGGHENYAYDLFVQECREAWHAGHRNVINYEFTCKETFHKTL